MKIRNYALSIDQLPVDLFADPDGPFSYEELVAAAGLDPDMRPLPVIGALLEPWGEHPDGAAVVAAGGLTRVTIVEFSRAA